MELTTAFSAIIGDEEQYVWMRRPHERDVGDNFS